MSSEGEHVEGDGSGRDSLSSIVAILRHALWRFRYLILACFTVGVAVGLFRAVVTPNVYRSVGKLFVKPGIRGTASLEAEFAGAGSAARISGSREAVQNVMQALSSRALFDKIVNLVGVDTVLAPYDPAGVNSDTLPWHTALFHAVQSWWFSSPASSLPTDVEADRSTIASLILQGSLVIVPESVASVISLSYVSHSPERARQVVDAALQAAMALHSEVFMSMASLAKIEEEMKAAELSATEAERALREFRMQKKLYDSETQRTSELATLSEVSRSLESTKATVKRREAELQQLIAVHTQLPPEKPRTGAQTVTVNPIYTDLAEQRSRLRMQLEQLMLAPNQNDDVTHGRRVKALENLLASIDHEIQQVPKQLILQGVPEENPFYLAIAQRIAEVTVDLKGLASTVQVFEAQRAEIEAHLAALEAMSPELRQLEIEAAQRRSTADTLRREVTTQRAVQRLDQLNLSNVSVMQYATYEVTKVAPSRSKMIAFGMLAGGCVGMVIAALLALVDRRVRIGADLVRLGVPTQDVFLAGTGAGKNTRNGLPASLASIGDDIARLWATVSYDRRATAGLRIAFVPCGDRADAGRAAAAMAIGLAVHGGEKVLYVGTIAGSTWLAQRLGLQVKEGWGQALRGERSIESVVHATPVPGLSHLAAGDTGSKPPHPMAGPGFIALLDQLAASYRFVVIELPDLGVIPAGRSVMACLDGVAVVACGSATTKESVKSTLAAVASSGARTLGVILQGDSVRESVDGGETSTS